ncbi:response regulator receiver modulated diguanylate cyclase [Gloeothece citriformis PCC 7424]|uniref:Response regulator receiver modulated diguanylate cyclase n=1 Tax=Gloeothece citriformis (strain PCC 7424) TaxID=65393 RepID=B7KHJ0_GLOC7|nr:diguanylate cyclase [Gloeothece citriformis]ACK70685.1 response regulator receiver modulated diguanylate cyclase [Gloeothece citriformis PCC 7424]
MRYFSAENFLIMIVDSESQNLQLLDSILERAGYKRILAVNVKQVFELIKVTKPNLILLKQSRGNLDSLQLCKNLKNNPLYEDIPILFIINNSPKNNLLNLFESGAEDYINYPFHFPELLKRIKTYLELNYIKAQLNQSLTDSEKLPTIDSLTGLFNRNHFLTLIEQEINRSCRYNYFLSLFILDVDNLRQVQELYDQKGENNLIQLIAKTLSESLRKEDYIGRFSKKKFIVLLPQTSTHFALKVAQRIQKIINHLEIYNKDKRISITVSIGLTTYHINHENVEQLIQRTNQTLLEAQNQGHNQIVIHPNDLKNLLAS